MNREEKHPPLICGQSGEAWLCSWMQMSHSPVFFSLPAMLWIKTWCSFSSFYKQIFCPVNESGLLQCGYSSGANTWPRRKEKPNVSRADERERGMWWKENRIRAHTKRRMERLNGKLIGGYEVTRDDRSTKVKETDVWLFISRSDIEKDLKGCDTRRL